MSRDRSTGARVPSTVVLLGGPSVAFDPVSSPPRRLNPHAQAPDQVARAVAGDRAAWRSLLEALAPHVLRTTRKILWNSADAEDAAQEALAVIARDLHTLRDPRAALPFALRAASRVALKARHRIRRARQQREALARESQDADAAPCPAATTLARDRAERVLGALDKLPSDQAETLVLRYVLGLEPSEIAAAMQVPVNTVRSRLRLARNAVARRLARDPAWIAEKDARP